MKKVSTIFFILALFICLGEGLAQDSCITISGSVTLTSQAQLDAYWQQNPGLCIDTIEGDLILAGDVEDLSGFIGLRYIGGGIFAPGSLQRSPSLRGLDSLTEIDDYLNLNTQVYDLDALSNLRAVGRNIDNNIARGATKKISFGAGSYDNLDALSNLQLAQGCLLEISNCTIGDATGLKNLRGLYNIILYQSTIDTFPDLIHVDSLHQLYITRVGGLSTLKFSNLEYLNELDVSSTSIRSLTFDKPIYMGRRKRSPDDEYFDNDAEIRLSGAIECLSADFRRADSLEFLEVFIAGLEPRADCPKLDLSKMPMDRLRLSSANVEDTLNLPFYPPNNQFTWGKADRSKSSSKYGVEYRISNMPDINHIILPDTGIMILGSSFSEFDSLVDVELDLHQDTGQLQALHIRNANSLVHAQAFDQIKGSVNVYERNITNSGARLDAVSIEIIDCEKLQLRKTDFANVDSAWGIWLENIPSTTELPSFSNLKWVRQAGLKDMPIYNDTLFSNDTRIEHYLGITALEEDLSNGRLFINHDPLLDTFAFFNHNLNRSGVFLNYNHSNLLIEGLNDVTTSGSLEIHNVNENLESNPNLLSDLEEVNSVLIQNIQNTAIPKIGNIENLYEYAWFDERNQAWYTDRYNETLKVFNVQNITDATAVCPLINSGNYQDLDLDPANSYPLHDAAVLVSYCDSNRISTTTNLDQWRAFTAYPTVNTSGGAVNFKGLESYSGTLRYRILDLSGREQARGRLVNGSYGRVDAISLPYNLPEGQYFLDVVDEKGRRGTSVIQIVMRP